MTDNIQQQLVNAADAWMAQSKDPHDMVAQLREAVIADPNDKISWAKLDQLVGSQLSFGTAGLRAEMGPGWSQINRVTIRLATQGVAEYLIEKYWQTSPITVLVGHDHRHNSDNLARWTAATLQSTGKIRVKLMQHIVPTPFVPFGVLKLGAQFGIMITASHNPARDNGYKVYGENGCQIVEPVDRLIAEKIRAQALKLWEGVDLSQSGLLEDPYDGIKTGYLEMAVALMQGLNEDCWSNINRESLHHAPPPPPPVAYTPMHGVGGAVVEALLDKLTTAKDILTPVAEQMLPDPNFPTVTFPNPEEGMGALSLALRTADESGARLVFANDPDADRFNFAERNPVTGEWRIFTGNEIAAILASYLWSKTSDDRKNARYAVLASCVSSKLLSRMADVEGFRFEETLTGFKYLGNRALQLVKDQGYRLLLATEEAIGFMVNTAVPDKDGITALFAIWSCAAHLYSKQQTFSDYLDSIYQRYGYHGQYNSYYFCHPPKKPAEIFAQLRSKLGISDGNVEGSTVSKVPGMPHIRITGKRDWPKTMMVRLDLEEEEEEGGGGSKYWLIVRASGTEPKIKFYSEVCCDAKDTTLTEVIQQRLVKAVKDTCEWLLDPKTNGLVAKE